MADLTIDTLDEDKDKAQRELDDYLLGEEAEQSNLNSRVVTDKAAMGALVNPKEDIVNTYVESRVQLESIGKSDTLDEIFVVDAQEQAEEDKLTAIFLATDINSTEQEKIQDIKELRRLRDLYPNRDLSEIMLDQQINSLLEDTPARRISKTGLIKDFGKLNKERRIIDQVLAEEIVKLPEVRGEVGETFLEFSLSTVSPGFGVLFANLIEDVTPGTVDFSDKLLPGELIKQFKTTYKQAPIDKKVEMIRKVGKLVEEHSGFFFEDRTVAQEYLETLFRDIDPTEQDLNNEKYLTNIFAALDLFPLAGSAASSVLKKTVPAYADRVGKVKRNSVASKLAESNPETSRELLTLALTRNEEELLDVLGTDKKQILDTYSLPLDDGSIIPIGPDLNDRVQSIVKEDHLGFQTHGANYRPDEKLKAQSDYEERLDLIKEISGQSLVSKTKIIPVEGGFRARTAISLSPERGFRSMSQAEDVAGMYLENTSGADIRYWRANRETGQYEEIGGVERSVLSANESDNGDYLFTVELKHNYNKFDAGVFQNEIVGQGGEAAKFLDTSVVFRTIGKAINVAGDQSDALKKQFHQQLEPLTKLNTNNQRLVLNVLDEGSTKGKWFTDDELKEKFADKGVPRDGKQMDKLIDAYESKRQFEDHMYLINNSRLRAKLEGEGNKSIVISSREGEDAIETVGRPLIEPSTYREVSIAYDNKSNTALKLSPEDVDRLYEQGKQIVRVKFPHKADDGRKYSHVVIDKSEGDKISNLPSNVLKKVDGYNTRIYEAAHLVKQFTNEMVDGELVPVSKVVSVEDNPVDAQRAVRILRNRARLDALAKGEEVPDLEEMYATTRARELEEVDYVNGISPDYFNDRGQMFFSRRAPEEITTFSSKRIVKGIGESVDTVINNVSKHVAMDDLIQSLIKRWENTYGRDFGIEGKFPGTNKLKAADTLSKQDARSDAIAIQDRINFLIGTDKAFVDRVKDRLFIDSAEWIAKNKEGDYWAAVAKGLIQGRDTAIASPIKTAKNIAFIRYIVLNPVKQLWMQANSASVMLGADGGLGYFFGQGTKDFAGLMMGQMMDKGSDTWKVMAPRMAKAMNMSVKEYELFLDAYKRTGLQQSISSHQFLASMALDRRVGGLQSAMPGKVRDSLELLRRGLATSRKGFEAGEAVNIGAGFLQARNEWLTRTRKAIQEGRMQPVGNINRLWLRKDNLEQIAARARELTFNMNQVSATAFQKGGLSSLFQFTSHAHKSMQAIIPDTAFTQRIAGKQFTNREKARIAGIQTLLYGTAGIPLFREATNFISEVSGTPLDSDTRALMEEGIFFEAFIQAIDAFTDENSDPVLSGQVAPFTALSSESTAPINKVVATMWDIATSQSLSPLDELLGPGLSASWDIVETIQFMSWMAGNVEVDTDDPHKATLLVEEALNLVPAFSNGFKWRLYSEAGILSNKFGDPATRLTMNEMVLKSLLGTQARDERDVNELILELRGRGFEQREAPAGSELREEATNLVNYARKVTASFQKNGYDLNRHEVGMKIKTAMESLKLAYGTKQFNKIMNMYHEMMEGKERIESGERVQTNAELLRLDINKAIEQSKIMSNSRLATKIRNAGIFQDEDSLIQRLMGNTPSSELGEERAEQEVR